MKWHGCKLRNALFHEYKGMLQIHLNNIGAKQILCPLESLWPLLLVFGFNTHFQMLYVAHHTLW